jgi:hypothetical protein
MEKKKKRELRTVGCGAERNNCIQKQQQNGEKIK